MAKKQQSFAEKAAKGLGKKGNICPTCGQAIESIKLVTSELSAIKSSWKFNQRFVAVCKCNEAEVFRA